MKCRMCGKEIEAKGSVVKCIHCGFEQIVPKEAFFFDFEQADACFRKGELEKASGKYEVILQKDGKDSLAHYMLALCRHGVEYVKDPKEMVFKPTLARLLYSLLKDDEDYKIALENSNDEQMEYFQKYGGEITGIERNPAT